MKLFLKIFGRKIFAQNFLERNFWNEKRRLKVKIQLLYEMTWGADKGKDFLEFDADLYLPR